RVVGVEEELTESGEVRGARDLWKDRAAALDHGLAGDAAREIETQEAPARDRGAHLHETAMIEERHARAGSASAGRRVDLARAPRRPEPHPPTRPRRSARRARRMTASSGA